MGTSELIAWISLGLTILGIVIPLTLQFIQEKKAKSKSKIEIETAAKKFIQDNSSERDYIHWATIAAGCFPHEKHKRKIYNEFSVLNDEVKVEVLRQLNINSDLIKYGKWISEKMELIIVAIEELGLGTNFLYDNAKYFHRAYDYKNSQLVSYETRHDFPDVFKVRDLKIVSTDKLTFGQYLDDFLYCKYDAPGKMPKKVVPPVDALLALYNLRSADEKIVTFWMMLLVEKVIPNAVHYLDYVIKDHSDTDAEAETYEDNYFSILYRLYYLDKSNGKNGNDKR